MTDRELLEKAAKAAGFEFRYGEKHTIMGEGIVCDFSKIMYVDHGRPDHFMTEWNPITNDGDAFRLAVKLNLCLGPNFKGDLCIVFGEDGYKTIEKYSTDRCVATRRAIVRAAAAIGERESWKCAG